MFSDSDDLELEQPSPFGSDEMEPSLRTDISSARSSVSSKASSPHQVAPQQPAHHTPSRSRSRAPSRAPSPSPSPSSFISHSWCFAFVCLIVVLVVEHCMADTNQNIGIDPNSKNGAPQTHSASNDNSFPRGAVSSSSSSSPNPSSHHSNKNDNHEEEPGRDRRRVEKNEKQRQQQREEERKHEHHHTHHHNHNHYHARHEEFRPEGPRYVRSKDIFPSFGERSYRDERKKPFPITTSAGLTSQQWVGPFEIFVVLSVLLALVYCFNQRPPPRTVYRVNHLFGQDRDAALMDLLTNSHYNGSYTHLYGVGVIPFCNFICYFEMNYCAGRAYQCSHGFSNFYGCCVVDHRFLEWSDHLNRVVVMSHHYIMYG